VIEIRLVDIDDEDEFARYYAIMRAADLSDRETVHVFTENELRILMDGSVSSEIFEPYAGFEAGEMVAAGLIFYSLDDSHVRLLLDLSLEHLRHEGAPR